MPSKESLLPPAGVRQNRPRRSAVRRTKTGWVLITVCALALITACGQARSPRVSPHESPREGITVKSYYLALGDSLAFGFQPNGDYSHGYAQQWFTMLQSKGSRTHIDYGCPGASTQDFVQKQGCGSTPTSHDRYTATQLNAAVSFLEAHRNQVSPVSLDLGSNDLVNAMAGAITRGATPSDCKVDGAKMEPAVAAAVKNLREQILPALVQALTSSSGQRTGDLVMMNLYDPLQNVCPATVSYVEDFNSGLAAAAAQFHVSVANVFTAFGGEGTGSPYRYYNPAICTYTWYTLACPANTSPTADPHPSTAGYGTIASAFNALAVSG